MDKEEDVRRQLHALFQHQHLAVLATEQDGQPYASLIAFAVSDDLKHLFFVTPRTTRKFENLAANPKVALLVDDSENRKADFHRAVAATIVGRAEVLGADESKMVQKTYLDRHPHLADFAASPTSALIRVNIRSFFLVRRFQQVMELHIRP